MLPLLSHFYPCPLTVDIMENISIFFNIENEVECRQDVTPTQLFADFCKPTLAVAAIILGSIGWTLAKTLLPSTHSRTTHKPNGETLKPQPARRYPHWDPFMGLDLLAVFTYGVMEDKFLETAARLVRNYGGPSYTVAYNFLGKPVIATFEPRNIKELLSTRFGDYVHGEDRLNTLRPLLGDGIFNCTGETWRVSQPLCRLLYLWPQCNRP